MADELGNLDLAGVVGRWCCRLLWPLLIVLLLSSCRLSGDADEFSDWQVSRLPIDETRTASVLVPPGWVRDATIDTTAPVVAVYDPSTPENVRGLPVELSLEVADDRFESARSYFDQRYELEDLALVELEGIPFDGAVESAAIRTTGEFESGDQLTVVRNAGRLTDGKIVEVSCYGVNPDFDLDECILIVSSVAVEQALEG